MYNVMRLQRYVNFYETRLPNIAEVLIFCNDRLSKTAVFNIADERLLTYLRLIKNIFKNHNTKDAICWNLTHIACEINIFLLCMIRHFVYGSGRFFFRTPTSVVIFAESRLTAALM